MGCGGVTAVTAHEDLERVAGGEHRAAPGGDHAGRVTSAHVQAKRGVGLALLEEPFLDHHLGAVIALLAGLEHEHDAAGQGGPPRGQHARGADQHGDVRVVTAGVHGAVDLGGEGQARVFLQGQGVHVGAQQHRPARPAAVERGDDRGRLLSRARLQAEAVERFQHRLLGPRQGEADLRVAMDAASERDRVVQQAAGFVEQRRVSCRHCSLLA